MVPKTPPLKTYLKTHKGLQKGKYKKRTTIYVYKCINEKCNNETHSTASCVKKISGRCRKCANSEAGKKSGIKNRILPHQALYNKFVADRIKFQQENSITFENFLEFIKIKSCNYCNSEIKWSEYNLCKNGSKYNLDRKDNTKGYSVENCVVCCWKCNETKRHLYSYEEFKVMITALNNWKKDGGSCGS